MIYSEGSSIIEVPDSSKLSRKNEVFLNPEKKQDRDLHVILINSLGWTGKSYLDLMSASGIRAIRLAKETKAFSKIVLNDIKNQAADNMRHNALRNSTEVVFYNKDAQTLLSQFKEAFDNIDIDPFGTPIYYVRDALSKLKNNGILSITATDTGCLSGSFPTSCARRYHSKSYLSEYYYESGLRILAKAVIEEASIFDSSLTPIFCHATKHYFRIYFRKKRGAKPADELLKKNVMISYCPHCLHREISCAKSCSNCKKDTVVYGPVYSGKMFDDKLLKKMLLQAGDYKELIERMIDENSIDAPWHYTTDRVSKVYKLTEPSITKLPYARTHINPKGFKTLDNIKKIVERFKE